MMNIDLLKEYIDVMREKGVAILEIADTKIILGDKPEPEIVQPLQEPVSYEDYSENQIFGD